MSSLKSFRMPIWLQAWLLPVLHGGAMVADQLKLPFIYVRPKPKEHGLGNQIEGQYQAKQKVVVIEDLVSTGKSSLQVVKVLRNAGVEVLGMVSIFNYQFDAAKKCVFRSQRIPLFAD